MQTSETQGIWRRLHWTMLLFGAGKIIRGTILPLLIFGYAAQKGFRFYLFFILLTGVVMPIVAVLLQYFSFRYQLNDGHIHIRKGIFFRKLRNIPVRRIHNINTSQSVLARWLKVLRLDIETAGGGRAEGSFVALSFPEARRIQNYVRLEKSDPSESTEREREKPRVKKTIYKITLKDILTAGATTNRMGIIFVGMAALSQYMGDYSGENLPKWGKEIFNWVGTLQNQSTFQIAVIAGLLFAALFVVAWIFSIVTALIRWHGFSLTDHDGDLNIKTGLFTNREFTIPRDKIQALRILTSSIRRPFRLVEIKVQSAGHIGLQEKSGAASDLLAPITKVDRTNHFARTVWPEANWDRVEWKQVHPYTRTRHFRILFVFWAAAVTGLYFGTDPFSNKLAIMAAILAPGVLASWLIAHLTYKQTAFAFEGNFVYLKTGFLSLHFWVIPVGKIQNLSVRQNPFQRFRGLTSLSLDVAGSASGRQALIPNIPLRTAWSLFNQLTCPVRLPVKVLPAPSREEAPAVL